MIYESPLQAAAMLADILPAQELENCLLICNSIKNIPFVEHFAQLMDLPYDLLFNKGIYTPDGGVQVAKISETREMVYVRELIESFAITPEYLSSMSKLLYDENILAKIKFFRRGEALTDVKGADVLVIDQGSNTGLTALLCLKTLLSLGAKSVRYASAVIATDAYEYLSLHFKKVYYLQICKDYVNKDFYYEQSLDISNEQALEILQTSQNYLPFLKEKYEN